MTKKKLKLTRQELAEMKKHTKGSKLQPYKDEILYLHIKKVANAEITKWLLKKGISVSTENVRQFCKRHIHEYDNVQFVLKKSPVH